MEAIAETSSSSFSYIDINSESSSPDSLPELQTDMECIRLNSSSSSASPSPAKITTRRRSSRSSTNAATKSLDEKLHEIKRRTISRPRRLDPSTLSANANAKLIEKLYTNKKLTKVKPTNLETIFEEPKTNKKEEVVFVSAIKYNRAINFKDPLNVNKQTVQTRRKRIKRLLGKTQKLKKITMAAFKKHLESFACGDEETVE